MPERKLLDQVSDVARLRHLSLRTEETGPQLEAIIITVMVLEMKAPASEDRRQKSGVRRWDCPAVNGRVLWANLHLVFWSRLRRLMCGSVSDLPKDGHQNFWGYAPRLHSMRSISTHSNVECL